MNPVTIICILGVNFYSKALVYFHIIMSHWLGTSCSILFTLMHNKRQKKPNDPFLISSHYSSLITESVSVHNLIAKVSSLHQAPGDLVMWTHITYACFHLHFRWVLISCESVCRLRTTAPVWIPPHWGEGEDFHAHIWSCRNSPAVLSFSAAVDSHSRHVQVIPSQPSQRGCSDGAIRSDCSLSEC